MDKNRCTVKLLLLKKTYKWENLEIIREDCWNSGRQHLKGIVFSNRRREKMERFIQLIKLFDHYNF